MQLVYFNDLHKNLGCNMGRTAKISIIPVTFTVLPVIFYALPPPAALFFSHSLPPPSSNCPARTDISIAQKTCVFRPVDISVAAKRNKLIYQSVYSLLGTELPQSKPDGFASSLWEGAFGMAGRFPAEMETCLPGSTPSVIACGDATFPKGTAFGRWRQSFRHSVKASP